MGGSLQVFPRPRPDRPAATFVGRSSRLPRPEERSSKSSRLPMGYLIIEIPDSFASGPEDKRVEKNSPTPGWRYPIKSTRSVNALKLPAGPAAGSLETNCGVPHYITRIYKKLRPQAAIRKIGLSGSTALPNRPFLQGIWDIIIRRQKNNRIRT